jgi:hypothetical protein
MQEASCAGLIAAFVRKARIAQARKERSVFGNATMRVPKIQLDVIATARLATGNRSFTLASRNRTHDAKQVRTEAMT